MGSAINGHGRRLPRMGAAACESYDHGIGARPSGNRLRHRLGQRPGADYRASQRVLFQLFLHPSDSHVYHRRATELDRIRGICGYRSRGRTAFFAGAEARRIEIERLYRQLTEAFDRASEAETLRRSEQLKTALLDAVTHDLRTPLTSIKASVTTLLTAMGNNDGADSSLSAEGSRELLDVINEESDSLNHFVEEMMTLAQLEGGQLLLRRREMPAQDIINIAVDRAATPLRERIINVSVANKLPPLVVDGASISGVIYELLVNAAKYSAPDSMIHINAQQISAKEVEIAVENEGAALPVAVRQRVFEKFYRGTKAQGEKQGFGLGLAIARGVVEAHGGRIRMDAGPRGAGTAVRFTVPCAPGANADALTS